MLTIPAGTNASLGDRLVDTQGLGYKAGWVICAGRDEHGIALLGDVSKCCHVLLCYPQACGLTASLRPAARHATFNCD